MALHRQRATATPTARDSGGLRPNRGDTSDSDRSPRAVPRQSPGQGNTQAGSQDIHQEENQAPLPPTQEEQQQGPLRRVHSPGDDLLIAEPLQTALGGSIMEAWLACPMKSILEVKRLMAMGSSVPAMYKILALPSATWLEAVRATLPQLTII